MRLSGCLLRCEQANVVVISASRSGRLKGAAPVWLGRIFNSEQNTVIARWIAAGGPGLAPLPAELTSHLTKPFVPPLLEVVGMTPVDDQPSPAER